MLQISDFTKPELDFLIENCNFLDEELEYFNLRSRGKSNVEISMAMHISEPKVSKLAKKVKSKIMRVL